MRGQPGSPVSLDRYAAVDTIHGVNTQLPDNGGVSGASYWMKTFGAQLPGPFLTDVRTGLSPTAGSLDVVSVDTTPVHSSSSYISKDSITSGMICQARFSQVSENAV